MILVVPMILVVFPTAPLEDGCCLCPWIWLDLGLVFPGVFPPREAGEASMMLRAPVGCSSGFCPPSKARTASILPRLPAGEGLLSSTGFRPPGEALCRSSGFRPPREAGAASMMPHLSAGVGRRFRSNVATKNTVQPMRDDYAPRLIHSSPSTEDEIGCYWYILNGTKWWYKVDHLIVST